MIKLGKILIEIKIVNNKNITPEMIDDLNHSIVNLIYYGDERRQGEQYIPGHEEKVENYNKVRRKYFEIMREKGLMIWTLENFQQLSPQLLKRMYWDLNIFKNNFKQKYNL